MTNQILTALSRLGWAAALAYSVLRTTGCAVDTPTVAFSGSDLTAEHRAVTEAAMAAWCDATGGECCPTLDGSNPIREVDTLPRDWTGMTRVREGWTEIQILRAVTDLDVWYGNVLHELGHACAARHGLYGEGIPGSGVMSHYHDSDTDTWQITESDVRYATGQSGSSEVIK